MFHTIATARTCMHLWPTPVEDPKVVVAAEPAEWCRNVFICLVGFISIALIVVSVLLMDLRHDYPPAMSVPPASGGYWPSSLMLELLLLLSLPELVEQFVIRRDRGW